MISARENRVPMVPLTAIDADGASVSAHKHECQDIRITSASGSRPCLHHPLPLKKRHINDASVLPPFCMTTDLHTAYHLNHHAGPHRILHTDLLRPEYGLLATAPGPATHRRPHQARARQEPLHRRRRIPSRGPVSQLLSTTAAPSSSNIISGDHITPTAALNLNG